MMIVVMQAKHLLMEAGDIRRFPAGVSHVYAFLSCPNGLLEALAEAWNASREDGPTWLINFEQEKTMEEFGFNVEFVASLSGLNMAGTWQINVLNMLMMQAYCYLNLDCPILSILQGQMRARLCVYTGGLMVISSLAVVHRKPL